MCLQMKIINMHSNTFNMQILNIDWQKSLQYKHLPEEYSYNANKRKQLEMNAVEFHCANTKHVQLDGNLIRLEKLRLIQAVIEFKFN